MRYFPISIDTRNKTVLVFGGGKSAVEKIRLLLDTEIKIYCLADNFSDEILELKEKFPERLLLKGRTLNEDFVFFGYDYCIIATDDIKLNQALADRAKKSSIEYFRADKIGESSFKINEIMKQGGLSVAMLTEGISSDVLKQITSDIENVLFKYDIEKLNLLNEARHILVLRNSPNIREEIEKLSKSNVAIIKAYLENLKAQDVDIVGEFINDSKTPEEKEIEENKESEKIPEEKESEENSEL